MNDEPNKIDWKFILANAKKLAEGSANLKIRQPLKGFTPEQSQDLKELLEKIKGLYAKIQELNSRFDYDRNRFESFELPITLFMYGIDLSREDEV